MADRLQKVLADAGLASRREAERWIDAGRVTVNGTTAILGTRAEPSAAICVDGKLIKTELPAEAKRLVLLYNKPSGEICSRRDEKGRASVFDALPKPEAGRWISVGRLDFNTTGVLLFTTDGALANLLMHPSAGLEREYLVRVHGRPSDKDLVTLRSGIELEDGLAKFETIRKTNDSTASNTWFSVSLLEGRNREVRRLWEALGFQVSRLTRSRYGPVMLPRNLPAGRWRYLDSAEIETLVGSIKPKKHNN